MTQLVGILNVTPDSFSDGGLFIDPFWVRRTHGVLIRMCLADAECTAEYKEVVAQVADSWDGLELEALMDAWLAQIAEPFAQDTRRNTLAEGVQQQQDVRRWFIRGRADALRAAVAGH